VTHRHVLTRVASACRVNTRPSARVCAARLEKQFPHRIYESNRPLAGINTAQSAIKFAVTNITFADGKNQSFLYDGTAQGQQTGSLREMIDASGSTRYERDPFGRITKKSQTVLDNPANPTVLTTSYAYTAAGELAQITYPSGLNVFYRRNASGQIASIDTQRPRTSVLRAPATTTLISNLSHTALNQPKAWHWNCITGNLYTPAIQQNCDAATRSFDADGRITATEFSTLSYDAASRITGITQNLWASRTVTQVVGTSTNIVTELYPAPFSWQAGYDNRNRLTSFNRPGSEQSYTYDANSNRLTSIAKKISDTDIDGLFEATDRAATTAQSLNIAATSNKLLGFNQSVLTQATAANGTRRTVSNVISQINYQLDANGNLTSDGLRTFDYNAENRLEKVQITQSGEAAKITYLHNAQGQRVFKSEPQTAQTLPNETELGATFTDWLKKNFSWLYAQAQTNATLGTSYSYGEGQLPSWAMTGEYGNGGAASTGRTEYIWLPTDDGNAIPVGMFRSNRFYAIHSDHLGTPRLVTDDTAKPVWQWAYSAFGDNKPTGVLKVTTNPNTAFTSAPLLAATNPAVVFNLRFPGQYADSETGLFYNYYRTYQPTQGRYTQADPIGLDGGWNRFGYVEANPLSWIDPEGLVGLYNDGSVNVNAYPGPPAGGNEHARAGAGQSYHVHIRDSSGREVRISTETWKPLTPQDQKIYDQSKPIRNFCDGLSPGEKKFYDRVNRQVFHKGYPTINQTLRIGGARGRTGGRSQE
jgi:RHS repeat-associated protein